VWIGADVTFEPIPTEPEPEAVAGQADIWEGVDEASGTTESPQVILVGGTVQDPTYRIGKLEAANKKVVAVTPNQAVTEAVTIMLINGFSQLPVMQSDRDVKGVISWESIGARLALGRHCTEVRECMSPAQVIGAEKSLFAAIEAIAQHQYVLVQAADKTISGIVTTSDLSLQFQQLTEPFLLLGEIEQHIRRLICEKFTADELKSVQDPSDAGREIESVADLAMGEYIRLLEDPKHWERLTLPIDRATFIEHLQTVRRIRNDIMHFDPDPLRKDDFASLRQFASFMRSLRDLGVVQ
jgi:CBS domain-containing protein